MVKPGGPGMGQQSGETGGEVHLIHGAEGVTLADSGQESAVGGGSHWQKSNRLTRCGEVITLLC